MIMLAKVVPYGGNAVRYALEKEKGRDCPDRHLVYDEASLPVTSAGQDCGEKS